MVMTMLVPQMLYSLIQNMNDFRMIKLITTIMLIFIATVGMAQEAPSCPDRGTDPSAFCLPGTTWDETAKSCVGLA
tara:strand:+ start:308 stop:535 length:228 start_codon:yes stop_codon:yes gene_type:complete